MTTYTITLTSVSAGIPAPALAFSENLHRRQERIAAIFQHHSYYVLRWLDLLKASAITLRASQIEPLAPNNISQFLEALKNFAEATNHSQIIQKSTPEDFLFPNEREEAIEKARESLTAAQENLNKVSAEIGITYVLKNHLESTPAT